MNYIFVITIIFIGLGCPVKATDVDDCGYHAILPETKISNCDKQPCIFKIGGEASMSINFRSPKLLENFKPQAVATVEGMDVTYPLGQNDACIGITNTPCPIAEGELVKYSYNMKILSIFPQIGFTLQFSLVDKNQNNEPITCFKITAQTKK